MANCISTDLLLFSAGAIPVNFISYVKNSDCMNLGAGDSRCHGRSFSMEEKERMTQIASVNGSYNHGLALLLTWFVSQSTHSPLKSCL